VPLLLADEDRANARRLQRMAEQGQLRRIHPGIYTDDLVQPLEAIVRRELYALCAAIAPRGSHLTIHRSRQRKKPNRYRQLDSPYLLGLRVLCSLFEPDLSRES
jgi:hypothetical protein